MYVDNDAARQLLKMPRQLVSREELGKLIAKASGDISMINDSKLYGQIDI
jgi:hypothetical protein